MKGITAVLDQKYFKLAIRSLSKPICQKAFLGEVQASIAAYSDLFEAHRQPTKWRLEIGFERDLIYFYGHTKQWVPLLQKKNVTGWRFRWCQV